MAPVRVIVKWQKEVLPEIVVDTEQPAEVFKGQLFALTGVPPERQKVMIKGAILKDDTDMTKLGLKDGQRLMMMGSADEIPKAPEKAPVFVEDLPEDEQATAPLGFTAGLVNLGNTCYMNSTVQCLHSVPELKAALQRYSSTNVADTKHALTTAMRELFVELGNSNRPVAPLKFWNFLRTVFPQFGQQTNTGVFMQQDAEECWTQLMFVLSQRLQPPPGDDKTGTVKDLFGIDFVNKITCPTTNEVSPQELETVYTLKCHISSDVNHLHEGLKKGLKEEIEKMSLTLNQSVPHIKESLINGLPMYLTVQFVRFFWKRETKQKAKILRKVDYPLVLDVFDLCSTDLKSKLETPRKALREQEDREAGLKGKEKAGEEKISAPAAEEPTQMEIDEPSGVPAMTGIYDLVAVLTHKGRSADSGHYVAWVKQQSGKWVEFDDQNPIPQAEEEITKLSGGGDWHTAYICLYKARLPK